VPRDRTKELLADLLENLYAEQATEVVPSQSGSYLMAANGQFLGRIDSNPFDNDSIHNQFGPYGSKFSETETHTERHTH